MSSERQELNSEASKMSSQGSELRSKASEVSSEGSELRSEATELHSLAICHTIAWLLWQILPTIYHMASPGPSPTSGNLRFSRRSLGKFDLEHSIGRQICGTLR